jgi:F-type H+-transporting ATPase subunit b
MSFKRLLSIAAVVAALALAGSGAAFAADDAHGEHGGVGHVPDMNWVGENPEGDGPPAILMFVNFAVFAGLIIYFGGPAIRRHLESRHTLIKDALDEASKIRAEAQAKLEEYSERIAGVDREVDELIKQVKADAEAEKQRMIEEGRQQAERMKRDAEDRIAAEFARARHEIEREVVTAAVAAAETILRDKATADDKRALVDAFITDIQSSKASGSAAPPRGAS